MKEMWDLFNEIENLLESIPRVIAAILILIVGLIAIKIVLKITRKALEKSVLDPVLYRFILTVIKVALNIVVILMVIAWLGGDMSALITVLAAAGAAVALALKDSLGNVAGGIIILINKPFVQNDFVDIDGISGKVRDIDLFVTHLKTYDNKVITVPNGLMNTSALINYTKENKRRVDCCFGIGYKDNIAKAKDILAAVAQTNPDIYANPVPVIGVSGQKDNGVWIDLKVWCETEEYENVKYFLEENVKLAFDEADITIP